MNNNRFDESLYCVSKNLRNALQKVDSTIKANTDEIRIRLEKPLALTVFGRTLFLNHNGQTSCVVTSDCISVSKNELDECFMLLCNNSVFAHGEELKNGYVKLKNGGRCGVFGTINCDGYIRDVTSLNIRIAREIKGTAVKAAKNFKSEGWLIAGPPGSGKTTFLRDFIRIISDGLLGDIHRVAVIDGRGEISGGGALDLGQATDVLNIEDKAKGIEIALRTMFPQVIAFDEIGNTEELKKIGESFNAGVPVITTAHIGVTGDLMKRNLTQSLLKSKAIEKVVVLPENHSGDIKIFNSGELCCDD